MNLKNLNLKSVNSKAVQSYKQKLKELKTWVEVKSPKPLQSALSYTLGWLLPELLGTGFRMVEVSDFAIKGMIPADASNLDSSEQIHQGLILNAALELCRTFINRHLPENYYRIVASDIRISKHQLWNQKLSLLLRSSESVLDQFFSELQENKKAVISFQIEIENFKKADLINIQLTCEPTNLLTGGRK